MSGSLNSGLGHLETIGMLIVAHCYRTRSERNFCQKVELQWAISLKSAVGLRADPFVCS